MNDQHFISIGEAHRVTHKSKIIRQVIEETGNNLTYSVPYHPETNGGIE